MMMNFGEIGGEMEGASEGARGGERVDRDRAALHIVLTGLSLVT